jgi:DNA mismatch endonuclease, patch repair protein
MIMGRIKSRGNRTTELRLLAILRRFRITGWRRGSQLIGRPDFVFARARLCIFVDGDFWHGHPRTYTLPRSNVKYWKDKIARNRRRDKLVTGQLQARRWRVLRLWESELRDEEAIAAKILLILGESQ